MSSILKSFQSLINDLDELVILLQKSNLDEELKFILTERLNKAIIILRSDEQSIPINENIGEVIDRTIEKINEIVNSCNNERIKEDLLIIMDELLNDKRRLNLVYEEQYDNIYDLIKELDKLRILILFNPNLNSDIKLSFAILIDNYIRRLRDHVERNYTNYFVDNLKNQFLKTSEKLDKVLQDEKLKQKLSDLYELFKMMKEKIN